MATSERSARETMQMLLSLCRAADPKAQALVNLEAGRRANTRFARNEITTGGDVDETTLSLTVSIGQRTASASTNQADEASLKALVERALSLAKTSPEDPETMPVLSAQTHGKAPLAFDAEVDALDASARARVAKASIDAGRPSSLHVAGYFRHRSSLIGCATSAGLLAIHPTTSVALSITARTADGSGSGQREAATRRYALLDAGALAAEACKTAVASQKPKKLDAGRYTVVLAPSAAAEFAEQMADMMRARATDEGRSYFSKPGGAGSKEKETLLSPLVTLRSDWASKETASLPFDDEGFPLKPVTFVNQGVIETLRCGRFWAKTHNRQATGELSALMMSPGTAASRDELIRGVKRGVLITRVWYTNYIDPKALVLTGLTRDGTFLIENGEIAGPVNNFRFNQSVAATLANVDALESSLALTGSADVRVPAFRTNDFWLASVSEAV